MLAALKSLDTRIQATVLVVSIFVTNSVSGTELSGKVKIDGSSTVFPVTEAIAEEFQLKNPRVRVTVGVSGTGGGFKKFTKELIDINDASRPIKPRERQSAKEAGIAYLELPVAYDGVSVVVHPGNKFVQSLTIDQLREVWKPGSSKQKWSDLDPRWPARKIRLFGPGPDSGTLDFFTEAVVGTPRASRRDYIASEDDNVIVSGVAGDLDSLGYFGYAYYEANRKKIRAVSLNTGKEKVQPNHNSITNNTYPLARPLFIYVSLKSAAKPEVDAFIRFYLTEARKIILDVGYIPLSKPMYKQVLSKYINAREKFNKPGSVIKMPQ